MLHVPNNDDDDDDDNSTLLLLADSTAIEADCRASIVKQISGGSSTEL